MQDSHDEAPLEIEIPQHIRDIFEKEEFNGQHLSADFWKPFDSAEDCFRAMQDVFTLDYRSPFQKGQEGGTYQGEISFHRYKNNKFD